MFNNKPKKNEFSYKSTALVGNNRVHSSPVLAKSLLKNKNINDVYEENSVLIIFLLVSITGETNTYNLDEVL